MRIRPLSEVKVRLNRPLFQSADEVESWKETLAIKSDQDFMDEIRKGLRLLRKRKARLDTLEELFDR